jgi:hypothetical protein
MPSYSSFVVMRWGVVWEGQVPTVAPEDVPPARVTMLVADGASATDAQVLATYLSGLDDADQQQLAIKAMSHGLITVTQLSNVTITAPAVPASLRAKGPPREREQRAQRRREPQAAPPEEPN